MYIIDKQKDFYDYHSYIYGMDKSIVFDRRGSNPLDNKTLCDLFYASTLSIAVNQGRGPEFLLLEVGNIQYLIELFDLVYDKNKEKLIDFSVSLFHTYKENQHMFSPVMSLRRIPLDISWAYFSQKKRKFNVPSIDELKRRGVKSRAIIDNPIIGETKLTSILDPVEIWIALQTYISSLDNDRDVSIPMTDKQKADIHGFNNQSFRHPIK